MRQKQITSINLFTLSVSEIINTISDRVLGDIPEGINSEEDVAQLERLLGRLPNDYAYVIGLLSHARSYVRYLKRQKLKEEYEDMMDKRDALESIANALKLQYQGVSRMITTYEQRREENGMYEYRKDPRDRNR